jgi:hypothetical protein
MYIRFTTPGAVTRAGIRPGFFRDASRAAWDYRDTPVGIALRHELDWFNDCLPVPCSRDGGRKRPFAVRAKGCWFKDGVCWFRDDAREHLTHAHVMAALMGDCGVPVTRQVAASPGQILYRDNWQVVAKPDWHWCESTPAPLFA